MLYMLCYNTLVRVGSRTATLRERSDQEPGNSAMEKERQLQANVVTLVTIFSLLTNHGPVIIAIGWCIVITTPPIY